MRGLVAGIMAGALVLAGCATRSTGVVEGANGLLGLTVSGTNLAAATERGLGEATAHCAGQGRQTQILGTQMGRDDYQLAFRCTGRTVAARPEPLPAPAAPPLALLQPERAPLLNGDAGARRVVAAAPVPPAQPRQALPPAARAAPGLVLLQPAAAPILGGETAARRQEPAAMPLAELPSVASLPPFTPRAPAALPPMEPLPSVAALPPVTPSVPLSTPPSRLLPAPAPSLPALSLGASLPPISGPVGLRRD